MPGPGASQQSQAGHRHASSAHGLQQHLPLSLFGLQLSCQAQISKRTPIGCSSMPQVHVNATKLPFAARTCIGCMSEFLTCGHNDGAVGLEAAVAALDVHEFLHPNVRAKPSLRHSPGHTLTSASDLFCCSSLFQHKNIAQRIWGIALSAQKLCTHAAAEHWQVV